MTILETQGLAARHAERVLAVAGTAQKNRALEAIARALKERESAILAENQKDLAAARESGMKASLLDRLALSPQRIDGIVEGVRQVAALPDPIGCVTRMEKRPNGLVIGKRRVPLGVIGIIYEARPNVTVDAAALCLKSGNAVILRGGKEAFRSNKAFVAVMRDALEVAGLPRDCVALVEDTSRASAQELMGLTGYLDVLIPRGGAGLIRTVVENARVPVIETGVGVCHVYVDGEADLDMGARILYNAKTSRPSVCNAAECLLVHAQAAEAFLPKAKALLDQKNVELRGCPRTCAILGEGVQPACEADWDTEFGDYILAVKVVEDAGEAIDFINAHGSGHSEAIVTNNYFTAQRFLDQVDAAAVYVNASTRFTDGFEFGLGAEIGISTQKMHARGPMGLEELTSSKYIVYGTGQVRE
ncbi:glutamate-5-semialdehyde dehydrogenase [Intestinimonas massiliensis]|jgi:glutamate-5-semialdehyde dehydrogenase|uniref:Gamma-glutamyl phosphate reductase n=1 Tax=Intestinimonas massiliensis (ex Afouda et al. 2020) TaxID=1673721 RepID=A0ABS9M564_9FIRM|nr:glutamate-5-semialdehyde dehydrogenase [Intestinimonas massiliensis (ex Afouda et al. 2020)]MCG4525681.1 glutamate-5-semialdehyde dehydrogenase [Intestinimonas massiliensis (ex Afouda et al. 2020)]MCQ4805729.1 glutamate-5-semialdehyde dehydrogenase [Intestinimonas massiliensis (ex Afouda et al. 2020)]